MVIIRPATTVMSAQGRSVKLSKPSHIRPKREVPVLISDCSSKAYFIADLLTPKYESATGIKNNLVNISTDTPTLVVIAKSRITGISIIMRTAKPKTFANKAVRPAINKRRKVKRAAT